MIFTGQNLKKLTGQKEMSFSLKDCSINNVTGSGEFGFSGENNTLKFRFNQGIVYDFNDLIVYSYQANNKFSISGSISSTRYSYKINDIEIIKGKTKNDFKLENFFINTTNCEINTLLKIMADNVSYSFTAPTSITKGQVFSVAFNNLSSSAKIHIFSVSVEESSSNYFSVNSFSAPSSVLENDSKTFSITNTDPSINFIELKLNFVTSIGLISKDFPLTLISAPVYIASNFLEQVHVKDTHAGIEYLYKFTSSVYKSLKESVSLSEYVPQQSRISLEYSSGVIGEFYEVTSVSILNGGSGYVNPIAVFTEGSLQTDMEPETMVEELNGTINSIRIFSPGHYFLNPPTVTFSGQSGPNSTSATGEVSTTNYTKTFTNSFNLGTGDNPLNISIDFLQQGLTQNQGTASYDSTNFGPGMYRSNLINVYYNVPYYIKIINSNDKELHTDLNTLSVKLKITNTYPDTSTSRTVEELAITA